MSTPACLLTDAQPAAEEISEESHGGGPRTEAGKAASSQNAITFGLFSTRDFIRSDEHDTYTEFAQYLQESLVPEGPLELNLVDEIRGAMWRLRRSRQIEENLSELPADPMEQEASARLQLSVDRARGLSHRLLHKCTAELRKLQTERQYRNTWFDVGTDISMFGLCDVNAIQKKVDKQRAAELRRQTLAGDAAINAMLTAPYPPRPLPTPEPPSSFCTGAPNNTPPPSQTPRNAPCPCGSGEKHKRCCGKDAPAVLHAA
jgi:hypothetical protein